MKRLYLNFLFGNYFEHNDEMFILPLELPGSRDHALFSYLMMVVLAFDASRRSVCCIEM